MYKNVGDKNFERRNLFIKIENVYVFVLFQLGISLQIKFKVKFASDIYPVETTLKPTDPCLNCGANTQCLNGICTCLPEYQGDPYLGCRPECLLNPDCSRDKACIRNKCRDPCDGICGYNSLCTVVNHIPICTCPSGMSGNAFIACNPITGICLSSLQSV